MAWRQSLIPELQTCNFAATTRPMILVRHLQPTMILVRGPADIGTAAPSRTDDDGTVVHHAADENSTTPKV
jgi:hypothetical protein